MKDHKQCYGKLFPSMQDTRSNITHQGKAFAFQIKQPGMVVTERLVETKLDQWDECTQCPEFDNCYRLSLAKLVLEIGVSRIPVSIGKVS